MPTRRLVTRYADALSLFPDMWHKVGLVACTVIALSFPFYVGDRWLTVGNLALVNVVGSVALMVLTGFCGQISLGHAAFLALGAYTAAILGNRYQLPFYVVLPAAGAVATVVGLATSAAALRVKGLYLAIVTLGLLFMVNHTLLAFPAYTNGHAGMSVPMFTLFGSSPADAADIFEPLVLGPIELRFEQKLYLIFLAVAALSALAAKNLSRSGAGRAMMAVRDRDMAAAALGVNPARAKIASFGVSSFIAGVAGAMFAFQQQYITVEPPFDLSMSVAYIAMIVLGGIGTVFGAVAGAIAYTFLTPVAESVGRHLPLLDRLSSAQQSTVLFSLLVCFVLVVEPLGLFGVWMRIKRYFMAWPFRY
jgi:branched-chain amino acid transport system permease protein